MTNFSNYYCLVILLYLSTPTCNKIEDSSTKDTENNDDDADDGTGLDSDFDPDVCDLPIDEGDCRNESLDTNEDGDDDNDNGIDELNDLNEIIDLNESSELNDLNEITDLDESNELSDSNENNTLYFGYNKSTKKCEQFNYEGCGGNENRFDTVHECRETCYTPLKNFLAKVTDLLMFRVSNGTYELPTT